MSIVRDMFEAEADAIVIALLASQQMTADTILQLGRTSLVNHYYVIGWILQNLSILNYPGNRCLLLYLEKLMTSGDNRANQLVGWMSGSISMSKPIFFETDTLSHLLIAMRDSGFLNEIRENSIYTNAVRCGNYKLFRVMLANGFDVPSSVFAKAQSEFFRLLQKKANPENYLLICKVMIEFELKIILKDFQKKIKSYPFFLNGGGDSSIAEIGHAVPAHAAKVFMMAVAALKSEDSLVDNYYELATNIIGELRPPEKGMFSMVGMFTARGERDASTAKCYEELIKIITKGFSYLQQHTELVEQLSQNEPSCYYDEIIRPDFAYGSD